VIRLATMTTYYIVSNRLDEIVTCFEAEQKPTDDEMRARHYPPERYTLHTDPPRRMLANYRHYAGRS